MKGSGSHLPDEHMPIAHQHPHNAHLRNARMHNAHCQSQKVCGEKNQPQRSASSLQRQRSLISAKGVSKIFGRPVQCPWTEGRCSGVLTGRFLCLATVFFKKRQLTMHIYTMHICSTPCVRLMTSPSVRLPLSLLTVVELCFAHRTPGLQAWMAAKSSASAWPASFGLY